MNATGLTDEEERTLLTALQAQPDFECLPIPASWFKKYNLPARAVVAPREFLESNYTMMRANEQKDLPPLIIDEPQDGGRVVAVPAPDDTTIELVSRPFVWDQNKPFPAVIVPTLENIKIPKLYSPEIQACMSQMSASQPPDDPPS